MRQRPDARRFPIVKRPIASYSTACRQFVETGALERRTVLKAGALSLFGLGLPDLVNGRSLQAVQAGDETSQRSFGRAKSCILLFMWGGPAHQDTWDLKPEAPAEVRGEFRPDCHARAGHRHLRAFSATGAANRQAVHRALDDARRRQPHHVDALPADRAAASARQRLSQRLAAHGGRAVETEPRNRTVAAVRLDAPEARKHRASLRGRIARPVRRLARPGA